MTIVKPPAAKPAKPMTKKQTAVIRKLALGTLAELDRRGWIKCDLYKDRVADGFEKVTGWDGEEFQRPIWKTISKTEAQVCLVGAASSAFNPFHPDNPGMTTEAEPDYDAFLRAVLAELPKRLQVQVAKRDNGFGAYWDGKTVSDAIATWNDANARTLKQVKTVLQKVADKHAPVAKTAAA